MKGSCSTVWHRSRPWSAATFPYHYYYDSVSTITMPMPTTNMTHYQCTMYVVRSLESGYEYWLPPYDTAYHRALRTTRTRLRTRRTAFFSGLTVHRGRLLERFQQLSRITITMIPYQLLLCPCRLLINVPCTWSDRWSVSCLARAPTARSQVFSSSFLSLQVLEGPGALS